MRKNLLFINVFIMLFFSSVLGAQVFGISLNKLAIIPFLIYMLLTTNIRDNHIVVGRRASILIMFFFLSIVSSIISLTASYSNIEGYTSNVINYTTQNIIFYIPLVVLVYNSTQKDEIITAVKKSISIIFRVNIIVAIIEFISYFIVGDALANQILSIFYGKNAQSAIINLFSLGTFIRPAGLNLDPAYFGIILCLGNVFEDKPFWRLMGFAVALIAMSRTAIVIICVLFIYRNYKNFKKIKFKYAMIALAVIIVAIIIFLTNDRISNQIMGMLRRFNFSSEMSSEDTGTARHLLYIPKSIEIFLFKYNLIQKLIGFGPRASGTILAHSNVMNKYLMPSSFTTRWVLECDFAELLLGYGLIGFILYYMIAFRLRNAGEYGKYFFIVVLLYSIMYDISSSTIVRLLMILMLCTSTNTSKPRNKYIYVQS